MEDEATRQPDKSGASQSPADDPRSRQAYEEGRRHGRSESQTGQHWYDGHRSQMPGQTYMPPGMYRPQQHSGPPMDPYDGRPMTAAQHEYRLRSMENEELRRKLDEVCRRVEELEERQQGNMQRGRSSSGRFTSGRGNAGYGYGANVQHDGDYYPMYAGHAPGADMRGYPYTEHAHWPGFAVDPRLFNAGQRIWDAIEPMVHRIQVDLKN